MDTEIKLKYDHGTAKKGEVFIRGDLSHGIPNYYLEKGETDEKKWYWAKDSKKEENRFLPASAINAPSVT